MAKKQLTIKIILTVVCLALTFFAGLFLSSVIGLSFKVGFQKTVITILSFCITPIFSIPMIWCKGFYRKVFPFVVFMLLSIAIYQEISMFNYFTC